MVYSQCFPTWMVILKGVFPDFVGPTLGLKGKKILRCPAPIMQSGIRSGIDGYDNNRVSDKQYWCNLNVIDLFLFLICIDHRMYTRMTLLDDKWWRQMRNEEQNSTVVKLQYPQQKGQRVDLWFAVRKMLRSRPSASEMILAWQPRSRSVFMAAVAINTAAI